MEDLHSWLADPSVTSSRIPFLSAVARPMWCAWQAHKAKDYIEAIHKAENIRAEDWRIAAIEWLKRRKLKAEVNAKPFTEVASGNA